MQIRPSRPDDTEALVERALEFIASSPYQGLLVPSEVHVRQVIEALTVVGQMLVACNGDDVPVGMIGAMPITAPISGERVLAEVVWWMDPAYRRGRVGLEMLARTEAYGRQVGCQAIHMIAPVGSPVAHLYRRRGYAEVETTWQRRL